MGTKDALQGVLATVDENVLVQELRCHRVPVPADQRQLRGERLDFEVDTAVVTGGRFTEGFIVAFVGGSALWHGSQENISSQSSGGKTDIVECEYW